MAAIQQMILGDLPPAVSLYLNMRSYWDLDDNDATTQFTDVCDGPLALNMNMTARQTAGTVNTSVVSTALFAKGGLAASFFPNTAEGTTAYVPDATNFEFPNADWTVFLWGNAIVNNAGGGSRWITGNIGNGTGFQWRACVDGADNQLHFGVSSNGTTIAANIDSGYTSAVNAILLAFTLNRTLSQIEMRWQDVTMGSMSKATAAFPGALFTGVTTANFNINDGLQGDSTYFAGTRAAMAGASCAGYLGKAMNDREFQTLFNTTNGLSWAQIKAAAGF